MAKKAKKEIDVKQLQEEAKKRTEQKEVTKPCGIRTILTLV